ncbi:hypothetical protein IE4771_CH03455 [Rhizobium etli bv. mimosae str. IE4771]|uniref:DUF1236 domain-containing protein n=2 Tax=Rhizobium etli TaxID=29449 RepID=A0A060I959_RHIET|nr:hypothetical protein IE4771_CH03455 [Rhizobium sp. IE4771]
MRRMRMRARSRVEPNLGDLMMKSNRLTMLVAALSLGVSPLATLPAVAQQDTNSGSQAQPSSPAGTDAGAQSGSGATGAQSGSGATGAQSGTGAAGADCVPDASGACPGQSTQQQSGQGSDTQKSAEQPATDKSSTSGSDSGKASAETKPGSQDASGGATTEQKPAAQSGSTDSTKSRTQNATPAEGTGSGTTTQSGDASKGSTDQNATTTNKSSSATTVNISVEQQTEIRTVVKEVNVAPVKEVDFTVSVGTTIPKKVRLERLPPRIVKIVPQYEGYQFFILADGRIVIVDPDALTIVYIIEA